MRYIHHKDGDPNNNEPDNLVVGDTEYDRMRKALISIMGLTVEHQDDGRMRVIHKTAMRGLGRSVKENNRG